MKLADRVGRKYGRLTVISRSGSDKWGNAEWLCSCDCGNEKVVNGTLLNSGDTRSCGCLVSDSKKGPKNPRWRGGKTMTNGYVQIKKPSHPRSNNQGYVFEHTLVMEKMLGRKLNRDEVVHHINQIRSDNDPGNLMLFATVNEHTGYHKRVVERL
jgi:hypothetical protein